LLINNLEFTQPIGALLVLGRGIDTDGVLSQTGYERTEVAIDIARLLHPKFIVFSGGHSWAQDMENHEYPSEGDAMLAHALAYLGDEELLETQLISENESVSTVENMVNSKILLEPAIKGETLGLLSDDLHFSKGRAQFLAGLVYPNISTEIFQISREISVSEIREEKLINLMTRIAMFGVTPGNDIAIMRRQHGFEKTNAVIRHATSGIFSQRCRLNSNN
jgi:hypothetical protein